MIDRNRIKSFFAPNSLRIQLLSRTLLILSVLLVLVGLFQYIFMRNIIYQNRAEAIRSQIMSIPHNAWEQSGFYENMHHPFFLIPESNIAFIDKQGNYSVISNGIEKITPPKLKEEVYQEALNRRSHPNYRIITENGIQQLVVLQPIINRPGEILGVAEVSTRTAPLKDLLLRQLFTFLLLSLIAMTFGLLCFLPVLNKTLVPLFNMVDTAEQIDAGNLNKRFPTRQGQMEIDRLAESFNGMLERLEASFEAERETKEQMRHFIADASHELRTPLTSIHGFLEVLLRGAANQPDQLHKALVSMHGEAERLNKLVRDLLLLAKLDRTPNIELSEGCLDTVIQDMEPQLRILAGNRKLSLKIDPNLKCRYNADSMKQVVLNLFQNAVQHTDPNEGFIQISLLRKNKAIQLSVTDNGAGINACHLPHVFDRFYRSDSSRTRQYGGAGLGLAITKSIIEAHKGTIKVSSNEGEGTTFEVCLPESEKQA